MQLVVQIVYGWNNFLEETKKITKFIIFQIKTKSTCSLNNYLLEDFLPVAENTLTLTVLNLKFHRVDGLLWICLATITYRAATLCGDLEKYSGKAYSVLKNFDIRHVPWIDLVDAHSNVQMSIWVPMLYFSLDAKIAASNAWAINSFLFFQKWYRTNSVCILEGYPHFVPQNSYCGVVFIAYANKMWSETSGASSDIVAIYSHLLISFTISPPPYPEHIVQ